MHMESPTGNMVASQLIRRGTSATLTLRLDIWQPSARTRDPVCSRCMQWCEYNTIVGCREACKQFDDVHTIALRRLTEASGIGPERETQRAREREGSKAAGAKAGGSSVGRLHAYLICCDNTDH